MNHYRIKMKFILAFFALFVFIVFSCTSTDRHDAHVKSKTIQRIDGRAKLEEAFVDSVRIGRSGFNKVSIFKYRTEDSNYVDVKFYKKLGNDWKLIQELQCSKDGDLGCDPKFADFNQDGRMDLTIVTAVAARGANQVRRLFIYDEKRNRLINMKNSEDYPNMEYNSELNCIDSWMFHGGVSTVFVRIIGDSLKEFAWVSLMDKLVVYETDKNGESNKIFEDASINIDDFGFQRFKNYKPWKIYKD